MRGFAAVAGLVGSLLAGVSAQDPPRRDLPPRPASGSAVIRGRVLAGDTGLPIRDAVVSLIETAPGPSPSVLVVTGLGPQSIERAPIASTSVDADGQFELRNVAAGT